MRAGVVPVDRIVAYARELLDGDGLLADVWIEGEVSNFFPAQSGHVYFTLRGDERQLKCALFRAQAARQRQLPRAGDLVAAHGQVTLYERDGTLTLYVDVVQPAGLGLAALNLERLRQRLETEGLFEPSRKRPLPAAPTTIGVVTSPDGAVWHDIQHVLRRRYPFTHLVLSPCLVQGERAPGSIVAALEALQVDGRAEVIIVARGGGAAEDLAAFNDETVVRAVFACRVPVVTGVGHETDRTLVDEVADLRAPTPSAAAELCVPAMAELAERLRQTSDRLARVATLALDAEQLRLGHARARLRRLDPTDAIGPLRVRLRELNSRGARRQRSTIDEARGRLAVQAGLLRALDPISVIGRGYAVVSDATTGTPIVRASEAVVGHAVRADFVDGSVLGRIEAVRGPSGGRPRATT